jgi:hypothetical protein
MDMAFNAVDANGKFTADYAAYTHLVIANRVQSQVNGNTVSRKDSMTFEQFMKAIQENRVVNEQFDRPLSTQEIRNNQIYMQHNGSDPFARQRFAMITRAYVLGLVDRNGVLISENEMTY